MTRLESLEMPLDIARIDLTVNRLPHRVVHGTSPYGGTMKTVTRQLLVLQLQPLSHIARAHTVEVAGLQGRLNELGRHHTTGITGQFRRRRALTLATAPGFANTH